MITYFQIGYLEYVHRVHTGRYPYAALPAEKRTAARQEYIAGCIHGEEQSVTITRTAKEAN